MIKIFQLKINFFSNVWKRRIVYWKKYNSNIAIVYKLSCKFHWKVQKFQVTGWEIVATALRVVAVLLVYAWTPSKSNA